MSNIHTISANWAIDPAMVTSYTTCRFPGNSLPPYEGLNCAHHVGDQQTHVTENRQAILNTLQCPSTPCWLNQTHSTHVVQADAYDGATEADASYTQTPHTVLALLTADCLPILCFHPKPYTIAAIHAGWKGMVHGIIEKTLEKMPQPLSDLHVWLGPAISATYYEVKDDFRQTLACHHPLLLKAIITRDNRLYFCSYHAARLILQSHGITHISGGDYCTYQMPFSFYSYRRASTTGRQASLIWLPQLTGCENRSVIR